MDLETILIIEAANRCHIYLYRYSGLAWMCCVRSALFFHILCPNIPYIERDLLDNGDRFPVMIIDSMSLQYLLDRMPPLEQNKECIVIKMPSDTSVV